MHVFTQGHVCFIRLRSGVGMYQNQHIPEIRFSALPENSIDSMIYVPNIRMIEHITQKLLEIDVAFMKNGLCIAYL